MISRIIRWLRGYVVFTLRGKFPERFINLSMRRGNPFLYVNPEKDCFEGAMLLVNYKEVRSAARRCFVTLRVKKRVGFPFFLSRYKNRKGLLCGFLIFLILSGVMRNFLWSIDVEGVSTMSESVVLRELRENSLYVGAPLWKLDEWAIERRLMQENTDIGWMSVNVMGTKAQVEIKEKVRKPEIVDYRTPCNIVASMDGLIVEMNTKQGTAKMGKGSAVVKGQLLVSGAMANALDEIDYVHSAAVVMAETKRSVSFTVPLAVSHKAPTREILRHRGEFLFLSVPLSFSSSDEDVTVRRETQKVYLNDTLLELGLTKEFVTEYEEKTIEITEDMARRILETDDALYRLFTLGECSEIKVNSSFHITPEGYELENTYTCLEDIAKEQIIIVN